MSDKITRAYGKEFPIGDIMHDSRDNTVYFILKTGSLGIQKIILVKNEQGTYDMMKSYTGKDGQPGIVKLGKTFPVSKKDGTIVEGMTQGSFALGTRWDKESSREVSDNRNALYFTTHRLRTPEQVNENLTKYGWVSGQYGIEIESGEGTQSGSSEVAREVPNIPEAASGNTKNDEEVPF